MPGAPQRANTHAQIEANSGPTLSLGKTLPRPEWAAVSKSVQLGLAESVVSLLNLETRFKSEVRAGRARWRPSTRLLTRVRAPFSCSRLRAPSRPCQPQGGAPPLGERPWRELLAAELAGRGGFDPLMAYFPYASDCLGGAEARRDDSWVAPGPGGHAAACVPGRYALAWSPADFELAAEGGLLPPGFVPPRADTSDASTSGASTSGASTIEATDASKCAPTAEM